MTDRQAKRDALVRKLEKAEQRAEALQQRAEALQQKVRKAAEALRDFDNAEKPEFILNRKLRRMDEQRVKFEAELRAAYAASRAAERAEREERAEQMQAAA